jgi:hypothetical protein
MRSSSISGGTRAVLLLALLGAFGCKVTADDIEEWKGTVKGPGKIVAVLLSDNYDLDLRTRAAVALVEMPPRTQPEQLDPVAELQRAITRLDPETRTQIIEKMVPDLERLMRGGESAPTAERLGPPTEQVRAKDAAFLLIQHAQGPTRDRLVRAVVGWYVEDFAGRNLAGNYSAEQIVRALGAPAAEQLVGALTSETAPPALVKITELIAALGSAETKNAAGARLVEIEQHMESDEFLNYLRERVRDQLRAQEGERVADLGVFYQNQDNKLVVRLVPPTSPAAQHLQPGDVLVAIGSDAITDPMVAVTRLAGPENSTVTVSYKRGEAAPVAVTITRQINQTRVDAVATHNREEFINQGALPAMKHLNSVPAVSDRLLAIAQTNATDEAAIPRREFALDAMVGGARQEHLNPLLDLALGAEVPNGVRDRAFDRVGDLRAESAIPRMWPLVENGSYENEGQRIRWRAGEMVLAIGGPAIVDQFLERLPDDEGVKYEPEELEGYATRLSQMSPAPTERVRRLLGSSDWWERVIALRYFERKGVASDEAAVQRLESDTAAVAGDGWARQEPAQVDVGDVATDALRGLRERLQGDSNGQANGQEPGAPNGGPSGSPSGNMAAGGSGG